MSKTILHYAPHEYLSTGSSIYHHLVVQQMPGPVTNPPRIRIRKGENGIIELGRSEALAIFAALNEWLADTKEDDGRE